MFPKQRYVFCLNFYLCSLIYFRILSSDVNVAAVVPLIIETAILTPGINFKRDITISFHATVATLVPTAPNTKFSSVLFIKFLD